MVNEKRLIYANGPLKQLSDYMEKLHCSDDYRDGLYRGMEIAESYIKNAPAVDAVEVPDEQLLRAVKLLLKQYEHSKKSAYVRNPVAHALYHTWKHFDK